MSKIIDDLNKFYQGLQQADKILGTFNDDLGNRLCGIDMELKKMREATSALKETQTGSVIQQLLQAKVAQWNETINQCLDEVEKNVAGHVFQNRFEKKALVIVYGIVKAGKSTLGNFIRGKDFVNAPFDNIYQDATKMHMDKIIVEESGRNDAKTKDYFDENSIESTCSAQYFEMPGLVWVDTPGTGAIVKAKDRVPLAEIAGKYAQYADLVIFLASSANPGVQEDVKGFHGLYSKGKKALVVLTRSDMPSSPTIGANGKIVKTTIAKPREQRQLQENSLKNAFADEGIPSEHLDAISLSTFLAKRAIEQNDDKLWEDSNLGTFYKKITDVISNSAVLELKKENPRKQLNAAIDAILGKENQNGNLGVLLTELTKTKNEIAERFSQLAPDGTLVTEITDDVVNQLRSKVRQTITEAETNTSGEEAHLSIRNLEKDINSIIKETLGERVRKIIGEFNQDTKSSFSTETIGATAKRRHEIQTYQVRVAYQVEREPDGVWENVCHFFGKKYHRLKHSTETRSIDIDLGIDTSEAKKQIMQQLEKAASDFIKSELANLRNNYFGELNKSIDGIITKIVDLQANLKKLRFAK